MGADQSFSRNSNRRPISLNHHEPSRVLGEVWNSYGRANQQKTPLERASENTEANEKICRSGRLGPVRPLSPTCQTGLAGVQKPRPVRPVLETSQTSYT